MRSIKNQFDKSCLRSFKQKDFCVKAHFSHLQSLQEVEHADWREGRREHVSRTGQQVNGLLLSLIRWNLRRWAGRQGSTWRGTEKGEEERNKKHWQSFSFQSSRNVDQIRFRSCSLLKRKLSVPFSDTVVSCKAVFQIRLRCDITAKGIGEVTVP